jgi:hypothetical protein
VQEEEAQALRRQRQEEEVQEEAKEALGGVMTRRERNLKAKRRARLGAGAGVTVGATLLLGGVADAANITVDSLADPTDTGHTTLRDAIHTINTTAPSDDSTITFASGLSGTINLTNELQINYPVSIQGPGAGQLAISGQDNVRVLYLESLSDGFNVSISGLTLTHGYAAGVMNDRLGGAIFDYNGDLTISNSVLSTNSAEGNGFNDGFGGAICACTHDAGSVTILDSTLSGNTATSAGGGIYSDFAPISITNSTLSANKAQYNGGGLSAYNPTGRVDIRNSTFTGNSTYDTDSLGGAVYSDVRDDPFTLTGATVTGNSAATAGGIFANDSDPSLDLRNTIVGNNTAATSPDVSGPFAAAFSLITSTQGATVTDLVPGSDIVGADPQLNGLAANGGAVQTMKPATSSPVIDKGAAFGLTGDQRGAARPVEIPTIPNSAAAGADGSDIGAVELQSSDFPTPATPAKPKCKKHKKKHKRSAESAKKKHKKAKCKKKGKKKKKG